MSIFFILEERYLYIFLCKPSTAKPKTGAQCADHVKESIERCFSRYNVDSTMFLVNITHDRRSVLGDATAARQFCG